MTSSLRKPIAAVSAQIQRFRSKHYPIAFLGDPAPLLKERMNAIERVTRSWPGATHFQRIPDGWMRNSRSIEGRHVARSLTAVQLNQLCLQLESACAAGLVHGDVHRKNILVDRNGAVADLIDWEPSLRQLRHGRAIWASTPGWQDPEDIARRTVTLRTDLLGVWRLATGAAPDFFEGAEWRHIKARCLKSSAPFHELICRLNENRP